MDRKETIIQVEFKVAGGDDDGRMVVVDVNDEFNANVWAVREEFKDYDDCVITIAYYGRAEELVDRTSVEPSGLTDAFIEDNVIDRIGRSS